MGKGLLCTACKVVLRSQEEFKSHYRSDLHNYNIKRKLVNLEPVSQEQFAQKQSYMTQNFTNESFEERCEICNRHFSSKQTYDQHIASRKHIQKNEQQEQAEQKTLEHIQPQPLVSCLFCNQLLEDISSNLEHMLLSHGFFIPDVEDLTSLEELMRYLFEKIHQGNICILCNNQGTRQFRSGLAVQQHMIDKQHCFINKEDDDIADFYVEEEWEEVSGDEEEVNHLGELVLKNGKVAGSKQNSRYYRQYFRPQPENTAHRTAITEQEYRGLVPVDNQPTHFKKVKTAQAKHERHQQLKTQLNNNRLKHHLRAQNPV